MHIDVKRKKLPSQARNQTIYIMKQLTGKCKRCNHGVKLGEHDPDTNLSNLRFADDILLLRGPLKHTPTMLDDLTTATTAHHTTCKFQPTKSKIISNTTSKHRRSNFVAVQRVNIEILPPEGKIKFLGQLITFENAVQVEFEHRFKCAWATSRSHRQELTSPKYPPRDRLKLFDDTVTPSHSSTPQARGR